MNDSGAKYSLQYFYKQDFLDDVYGKYLDMARKRDRGFTPFEADVVDYFANVVKKKSVSLVELGIGGGGAHKLWSTHLNGKVYGVDIYSPAEIYTEKYEFYKTESVHAALHGRNYNTAQNQLSILKNVNFYYAMDAYDRNTAKYIEHNNSAPLDVVIDDASPSGEGLYRLLPAWKESISHNGCLISETIYGNGTHRVYNMSESEKLEKLKIAHDQGFICFDFKKYKFPNPTTEHIITHLVFWSPNFELYKPVLEKYEDCRIHF